MPVYALLLSVYSSNASAQSPAAAAPTSWVAPADPGLLLREGRFAEIAALTADPLLVRRLAELDQALAIQAQYHKIFQPRHPRRDAADDRVRLLHAAVVAAATAAVGRLQPPA